MEVAFSLLAQTIPDNFRIIAGLLGNLDFETIHYLMIRSYTANGGQFFNDAINYLTEYPISFETGYCEDRYKAAKELLEAVTPYCSDEQITQLLISILKHYPDQRNQHYRLAQFILLDDIIPSKRSDSINRRLKDLKREFGNPPEKPPRLFAYGPVKSPVSEDQAENISDEQWLEKISFYYSDDNSFTHDTDFIGGAYQLSSVLEKQVRKHPSRFAALVDKFPDSINVHYFTAILRGIKDTDLDKETILKLCRRCHELKNKPCGKEISDIIGNIAESDLPVEALSMVAWYATRDLDPEIEIWQARSANGAAFYGGDILNAGLNSVRGRAAEAMSRLIFYNKDRINYFKNTLTEMVIDPLIEVRSWVALTLISVLRHDNDLALELFKKLCER